MSLATLAVVFLVLGVLQVICCNIYFKNLTHPYLTFKQGLDPSSIYFEGADPVVRLDPTDATLVDIVHTDASYKNSLRDHIGLGFSSALGSLLTKDRNDFSYN